MWALIGFISPESDNPFDGQDDGGQLPHPAFRNVVILFDALNDEQKLAAPASGQGVEIRDRHRVRVVDYLPDFHRDFLSGWD